MLPSQPDRNPPGFLDAIWRAVRAGALTWDDAQALQDNTMPLCARHQRPAKIIVHGNAQCERCFTEDRNRKGGRSQ